MGFGELPEIFSIEQQGLTIRTYPALVVNDDNQIDLKLLDSPSVAAHKTMNGFIKLYQVVSPEAAKYLRKQLLKGKDLQLKAAGLPSKATLIQNIIDAAYFQALLENKPIPRAPSDYEKVLTVGKGDIVLRATELEGLLISWLPLLSEIRKAIKKQGITAVHAVSDINQQLIFLFQDTFIFSVPLSWLKQYQRYLKAILMRLEKLPSQPQKDRELVFMFEKLEQRQAGFEEHWEMLSEQNQNEVWQYRFMLQEYRVSLFAQQLKTLFPISDKRIDAHWKVLKVILSGL